MRKTVEVLSVGNAIVDLLSHVDESFIGANNLQKGATSAYVGKIANDDLGAFFRGSMEAAEVSFHCDFPHDGVKTANCIALVTPDGERTMNTFLGACTELGEADIPRPLVEASKLVFIEGCLLDSPSAARAAFAAARMAKDAGTEVALSLSDANCVRRNREAFKTLVEGGLVDVLVGNEKEICAYFERDGLAPSRGNAFLKCSTLPVLTVMTLGADGAVARSPSKYDPEPASVGAVEVAEVVDLVGAGDAFAAGFLVGHVRGMPLRQALKLGAECAAEIVETVGARPRRPLTEVKGVQQVLGMVSELAPA